MENKLFRKGDIIVAAVILLFALIFALFRLNGAEKAVATVTVDGVAVKTVKLFSLKERIEITPEGNYNVKIIAENGEIWFEHSDCPDKLCVNSGKLKKGGDVAVCLPAKTVITVSGADVDAVVY